MSRSFAPVCVLVGGLLILAPVFSTQWRLHRVEVFHEQYGGGAVLPPELKPGPYTRYDWACFGAGLALVFVSLWRGCLRSPP